MANVFVNLPVTAGDGVGAWVDVSTQGPERTVSVDGGAFGGSLTLEGSNDAQASAAPAIVGPFIGPTFVPQTFVQAFNFLRVRRVNSGGVGTPTVNVGAPAAATNAFGAIAVPNADGVGAATDISGGGDINTIQVVGDFTGQLLIETSTDGASFSPTLLFTNGGGVGQQIQGVLKSVRVRRRGVTAGAAPLVSVGSQATAGGGGGGGVVNSVNAGVAILITGPAANPVVNNIGVTSAVAGAGIGVSAATGAVTFTNTGVTALVAGAGIAISGATGAVTVTATGGAFPGFGGAPPAVATASAAGAAGTASRSDHVHALDVVTYAPSVAGMQASGVYQQAWTGPAPGSAVPAVLAIAASLVPFGTQAAAPAAGTLTTSADLVYDTSGTNKNFGVNTSGVANQGALTVAGATTATYTAKIIVNPLGQSYKTFTGVDESGPGVFVRRLITNEATANEHGFIDASSFARAGLAYASFDSQPVFETPFNYDHHTDFQARGQFSTAGTLTNWYSFLSIPALLNAAGTITNLYHFTNNVVRPSLSTATNEYGVYLSSLFGTNTWAFYNASGNDSNKLAGKTGFGTGFDPLKPAFAVHVRANANAGAEPLYIQNASAGGSAYAGWAIGQTDDASGAIADTVKFSSGYTTLGSFTANSRMDRLSGGAGNYLFNIQQAAGDYVWLAGAGLGSQRMRLSNAGVVTVGTTAVGNDGSILVNSGANGQPIGGGTTAGIYIADPNANGRASLAVDDYVFAKNVVGYTNLNLTNLSVGVGAGNTLALSYLMDRAGAHTDAFTVDGTTGLTAAGLGVTFQVGTAGAEGLQVKPNAAGSDTFLGFQGALVAAATHGYPYIPNVNATPTGAPDAFGGIGAAAVYARNTTTLWLRDVPNASWIPFPAFFSTVAAGAGVMVTTNVPAGFNTTPKYWSFKDAAGVNTVIQFFQP